MCGLVPPKLHKALAKSSKVNCGSLAGWLCRMFIQEAVAYNEAGKVNDHAWLSVTAFLWKPKLVIYIVATCCMHLYKYGNLDRIQVEAMRLLTIQGIIFQQVETHIHTYQVWMTCKLKQGRNEKDRRR